MCSKMLPEMRERILGFPTNPSERISDEDLGEDFRKDFAEEPFRGANLGTILGAPWGGQF